MQCVLKQYDNVAWELKYDTLLWSDRVLNLPGGKLSEPQRDCISTLIKTVATLPDEAINVGNIRQNHKKAMTDPTWQSVRQLANELLLQLEAETKRVDVALWPNDNL